MATELPIARTIRRHSGDTWQSWAIIWKQSGVAVDITGYDATMNITSSEGGTLIATFTSVDGQLTVTGASGRVDLNVPFGDTADIAAGKYYYDLSISNGTIKRTLAMGDLIVSTDA